MENITAYVRWRGDIPMADDPFNDVDNVILSELGYLDLAGIVPPPLKEPRIGAATRGVTIKEAQRLYEQSADTRRRLAPASSADQLLKSLAASRRFSSIVLSDFVEMEDDGDSLSFAAMTCRLPDGSYYICYRGTGWSIEDWRQDFMISYTRIPAQEEAYAYLAERLNEHPRRSFSIGGHSKGGNLALYAGMAADALQHRRIRRIYSNDGPGICPELRDGAGYKRALAKLTRIIPEFSIIGMLFAPDAEATIVKSTAKGVMQHDAMSWKISGTGFDKADKPSRESMRYSRIFDSWIESASMEEREAFVRDFFDALKADGAKDINDIAGGGINGFGTILMSLANSESRTKIVIKKLLGTVFSQAKTIDYKAILRTQLGIIGVAAIFLGIVFIVLPNFSYHVIGYLLLGSCIALTARQIILTALSTRADKEKKVMLLLFLAAFAVLVFLLALPSFMTAFENIMVGCVFILLAVQLFRRTLSRATWDLPKVLGLIFSIAFVLLGIGSMISPDEILYGRSIAIGFFLILLGVFLLGAEAYKNARAASHR